MRVFIGYDPREHAAAEVAKASLLEVTRGDIDVTFLHDDKLRSQGIISRPVDYRGGRDYDIVSNANAATRFAVTRFLTPMLCGSGMALFVDCDMVFREDPRNMLGEISRRHAVSVVKHEHTPAADSKMMGQQQCAYPRKNWSSVMLFNCDHPANLRLSLRDVNERPGRDLHAFYWLNDREIGELDPRWNWLVNEQPEPAGRRGIAHFTNGGPWFPDWPETPNDDIWLKAAGRL